MLLSRARRGRSRRINCAAPVVVLLCIASVPGCARFGFSFLDDVATPPVDGVGAGGSSSAGGAPSAGASGGASAGAGAVSETPVQAGSGGSGGTAAGAGVDAGGGVVALDGGFSGAGSASGESPDAGAGGCAPDVPLRRRPEGTPPAVVDGRYDVSEPGWSRLARNTEWMRLIGQGYVALRWEIEYAARAGLINLPTIAASGVFLRVGGGGGYHLDDPEPATTGTYMGNPEQGVSYMPPGVETPWNIEYYYLDGDVTITINESSGLHNLQVRSQLYSEVITPGIGVYAPGVVCDRE